MKPRSTSSATPRSEQSGSSTWLIGLLALIGCLAFVLPLLGFLATLGLPRLAGRAQAGLWPGVSATRARLSAVVAVVTMWAPALTRFISGGRWSFAASTIWLIIPLCVPTGWALVLPALVAIGLYLAGLALSIGTGKPWVWVIGAAAMPWAYEAAVRWLVDFSVLC
jgi:hypothetical protein